MTNFSGVIKQLQNEKAKIEVQLQNVSSAVQALRGMGRNGATRATSSSGPRRVMSISARRRIAAAQKARWAKWRKQQKKAA